MTAAGKGFASLRILRLLLCMAVILHGWPADAEEGQTGSPDPLHPFGGSGRQQLLDNDPFRSPLEPGGISAGSIDDAGISAAPEEKDGDDPADSAGKTRIAIIIDDMGIHRHIDEQFLGLDLELSFAFLPYGPFTGELEEKAWAGGHEILVHMPMEPEDPQWDPGPDALYVQDSLEEMAAAVEKNLALVPHATGVNNHMGSLFTGDRPAMHRFLELIRRKGMYFIDSCTSAESIGMEEAHAMGIRTARRQVFLDNVQNRDDICLQMEELVRIARKNGEAIGIGHSCETTLTALVHCRDTLLEDVSLVGIRELVQ